MRCRTRCSRCFILTPDRVLCFSATANFVGSGVLGSLGVAAITKVRHRRELLFAALPILFAIHQFTEGFVWLGLQGAISPALTRVMGAAFMMFAHGLLPALLPLSVMLFEPDTKSRERMLPFLVLGCALSLYAIWALIAYPLMMYAQEHSIVYRNRMTSHTTFAALYVVATCGALFFSKVRMMVTFGALNVVILLAVMALRRYAFTSLWCAYAAIVSIVIVIYFWTSSEERPFSYMRQGQTPSRS